FGVKYNGPNGGPATEEVTDRIFAATQAITDYAMLDAQDVDLSTLGETRLGQMVVEVVDPVADYAALMAEIFDFDAIRALLAGGFRLHFDARHAITGP
ncbi:alpha-D-glucose phosphate-specific phosphoglucomutase, partial [Halomonas marinisediminis]